ncbi:MAG: 2OG-Fe(II) oxygenase [Legionellales bacterium]|nr:2OG-Fe(II) oxygenase [Legionellales bacterium]
MSFEIGDPAKLFTAKTTCAPATRFDGFAGQYVILFFFGSAKMESIKHFLNSLEARLGHHLNGENFMFLGVTIDPDDLGLERIKVRSKGIHYVMDYDHKVSHLYQVLKTDITEKTTKVGYRQGIFLLNPALRIIDTMPFTTSDATMDALVGKVEQITNDRINNIMSTHAPILIIPGVFEKSLCKTLIDLFDANGGYESGFMYEENGLTTLKKNAKIKRRKDYNLRSDINNIALLGEINHRINTRIVPEILKAFHFQVDYTERHIVCCYDANTGGYFLPHRDNLIKGTEHRRFAVTINLNAGEYEGGDLRFPEYGNATYRAPTGGAVIFSCSLLHEATPVIQGKRYAFVPFLYEQAGEKVRLENLKYVVNET